jgi:hypothetical protein
MQRWSMLHADLEHATAVGGLIPASAGIGTLFVVSTAYTLLARSRGPAVAARVAAEPTPIQQAAE